MMIHAAAGGRAMTPQQREKWFENAMKRCVGGVPIVPYTSPTVEEMRAVWKGYVPKKVAA